MIIVWDAEDEQKGEMGKVKGKVFSKHSIVKRVLSFVLAFAMVLTMGAFSNLGSVTARAEGGTTTVRLWLELPSGTSAGDWVANAWNDVTITGGTEQNVGGSWGAQSKPTLLADSNVSGWAYVDVSGNIAGFQFVQWIQDTSDTSSSPTCYDCWNSAITSGGHTNAYYDPTANKWYTDTAKATEIAELPAREIFNLAGDAGLTGSAWSLTADQLVQDSTDTNKYSITFSNVAPGTYEYQILQDQERKGWNLKWATDGQNMKVTVNEYSNVTFTIDVTDTNHDVKVDFEAAQAPSFTTAKITMHFQNTGNWDEVYCKLAQGSSWDAIDGYAYANGWPGAEVEADPNNQGWYSFTITMPTVAQFDLIFNNNNNGEQTGNITFTPAAEVTEQWVVYDTNIKDTKYTITDTVPSGWTSAASYNPPVDPLADSDLKSPVVNADGTVTFTFVDTTGKYDETTEVFLMGQMNGTDWNTGLEMTYDSTEKVWSVTTPVQTPGAYPYKYKVDSNWITDPLNSKTTADGNSKAVVPGLSAATVEAARGKEAALPATLDLFDADGNVTKETPTYTLKDPALAGDVTIADGKITVAEGTTMDEVVLTATSGAYTSEVTVSVKDKIYTYNIYYFDQTPAHMSTDAADIWAWEDGGGNIGAVPFTSLELLDDGNEWLKATLQTSASKLGLIPRSKGEWGWQTADHYFTNKDEAEECNIYIVYGDSKTYTELPEIKELRERYAVVEYDRPAGDYDGWNIYSWNTGLVSETEIYAEDKNGSMYMTVPVADYDVDLLLSFCMRQTTDDNAWAAKDGGDHYVNIPADQTVVKARFVQDEGIVEVLPYNTGYEMDGANDMIHFYYRDDMRFKENTLDELDGKVSVVVNGNSYAMAYDEVNERYFYDYSGLTAGDYEYHYVVDGADVLDAFNPNTTADGLNSVLTYKEYAVSVEAALTNPTMDYNDNNVLTVSFAGEDADEITAEEIASVEADLSALGLGTLAVEPELMQATIACLDSTSTGVKTIPVAVKDIYGAVYTTEAAVTVTERDKSDGDFDWDEAVIYFAVTDRFFDGNTANNDGVDKDGTLSYHGGDFAGMTAKLDYLKELGVNTIWLTPIVENSDTTTDKDGETIESTGYHGYWASDFTKLNSHLGTPEEFTALIDAAHARNMKIMVDVVVNHAGYETEDYFNTIIQDANGNYVSMIRDSENTVTGSDVYASLSGLPDFVTEDPAVREQIVAWQTDWMDQYDIDYYRVDTVKHVDSTTWAAFKNSLTEVNPAFKMTGEYAGAGYANTAGELGTGRMDALLDFDFNGFAADFLTGSISSVETSLEKRNTSLNNTATMSSFLNSHDEDGLAYTLQSERGLSVEESEELLKVAATLMITAKGQPVIYCGEEIGQYGQNNYPYQTNRNDFDWEELASQMDDSGSMYNHYKTMLAIRNDYTSVFAKGDRQSVMVSDKDGYDVFSRSYGGTTLYVGMNISDEAQTLEIPVSGATGSIYSDLYSGNAYAVSANGTVTVTIPAAVDGGTAVLVEEKQEDDYRLVIPVTNDFSEVIETAGKVSDGETITVLMADPAVEVPAEVFNAIAGRNITIRFVDNNGVFTWEVNGTSIPAPLTKAVCLNVIVGTNEIPADIVSGTAGDNDKVQISLTHDGDFGFTAKLTVNLGNTRAGRYANLFYYNEADKKLEYQEANVVAEDGCAAYTFTHASDYLVVFAAADMKPQPVEPAKPVEPSTPSINGVVSASGDTTNTTNTTATAVSPVTNDNAPLISICMLMMFGLAAVAGAYSKKRRPF